MTKETLWKKGINYKGTSLINGMHCFSAIVACPEIGENRLETYRVDGNRQEAFASADQYYQQWIVV